MALLEEWKQELRKAPPATATLARLVHSSIQATAFTPAHEFHLRKGNPIEVLRWEFASDLFPGPTVFSMR